MKRILVKLLDFFRLVHEGRKTFTLFPPQKKYEIKILSYEEIRRNIYRDNPIK